MNILPEIDKISNELKKIFKDLHQHPELGFEEVRTSEIGKKFSTCSFKNTEIM